MPPKRKLTVPNGVSGGDSQAEEVVNTATNPKRLRADQLFDDDEPTSEAKPTQRRSSRAGRGRGGAVQQLQNIERLQASRPSRQATRNLDIAMQGQVVNPMAPSYVSAEDDDESQIPPWLASSVPLTQVQPTFTRSQSDSRFRFKIPSKTTPTGTISAYTAPLRPVSTASTSSFSSSRGPSVLLAGAPRTTSTAPSSRAPSECGSNDEYDTIRRRVSRLELLGTAAQFPDTQGIQHQGSVDDAPGSVHPQHTVLRRTESFRQVPSTLPRMHSMLATGVEDETFQDNGSSRSLDIDEASPDEDERFAMSILYERRLPAAQNEVPDTSNRDGLDGGFDEQRDAPNRDSNHDHVPEDVTERSRRNRPSRPIVRQSLLVTESNSEADGQRGQSVMPNSRLDRVPESEVEDVVACHRQRNRPPRLPNNAQLLAARNQQTSQRLRNVSRATSVDELLAPISEQPLATPATAGPRSLSVDASAPVTSITANTGPGPQPDPGLVASGTHPDSTDPSHLHSYPPAICDVIERAKQFSHCDLASVNSFPLRPQFDSKAVEYMDEAVIERRDRALTIPEGWWPQCTKGITKLLWEDIGNWRSTLKKKARGLVRQGYEWDPQNRPPVNAEIAKRLLDRGSFLMNGQDEDGRTNNLAHPTLASLVVEFFYTGPNAVANLFPEVFEAEVPRPAVALAATAIKLALDEVVAEGKEVTFKCDIYADVYIDILGLMTKCDTSPVHRAKTKALRVQWAKMGRNGSGSGTTTGFDVALD